MRADEFPALLRELTIPGATVGPIVNRKGEPAGSGSGLEYGFLVTGAHGGRLAWQVALHTDKRTGAATGPPPAFPDPTPVDSDALSSEAIEACIAAWIGGSTAAPAVKAFERYSENTTGNTRYGLALHLHNGERVFIQLVWALAPGEEPGADNRYKMRESV